MAKGLNKVQVGLTFTADIGNAKAQLKDLKNQIDNLYVSTAKSGFTQGLTKDVNEALTSVTKLKSSLEAATNVDTGRLDLTKFSQQLKKSNMTLAQYATQMKRLGPEGEKAFLQLANSIVAAEVPMRHINAQLAEMWTTMKNTARWQISSSMLHSFMGSVQKAYGYAQDLNESLNDIRIVTGYNTDQMAKFAKEANKAAKALSATTTEYTNASLIYFQQGLDDQQVKERTDITIKMANVSSQSAEIVSDQMTAVWNNFYDGSKSLEYYADVMTKLGAATASSSDEIAQGLEKFAAIADTVGLSYDYAASALATVTAETRQSADVVGTAFKTIFARIEGLSLGETLEDGTDLNKYSVALATVGVNIKDTNGEMKQMDQILEELGSRWQTLGQDQKIALAQTVAGVRQYNQLIALMDNWGTFQENLSMAQNSEGALQEQADIYAESWEAARDRVTAAAESIYQSLLNDKFFIGINNGFAGVLEIVNKLIESMGGLPGVLGLVATGFTKAFGPQMIAGVNQMIENLKVSTGLAEAQADSLRRQSIEAIKTFNKDLVDAQLSEGGKDLTFSRELSDATALQGLGASGAEGQVMIDQIDRAYEIQKISQNISEEKARQLKEMMAIEEQYGKNMIAAKKESEEATRNYTIMRGSLVASGVDKGSNYSDAQSTVGDLEKSLNTSLEKEKDFQAISLDTVDGLKKLDEATLRWAANQENAREQLGATTKDLQRFAKTFVREKLNKEKSTKATEAYQKRLEALTNELKKSEKQVKNFGAGFVQTAKGIGQVTTGITSLTNAFDVLNNEDMSTMEKFGAILTSLTIGLPSLAGGIKSVAVGLKEMHGAQDGLGAAIAARVMGLNQQTLATLAAEKAQGALNKEELEGMAIPDDSAQKAAGKLLVAGTNTAEAETQKKVNEENSKEVAVSTLQRALNKLKAAQKGENISLTISEIAALKLKSMADKAETGGIVAKIAAKYGEATANTAVSASLTPLLGLTLAMLATIAPYVIAIGALVGIVYLLVKAYNADAEAAANAKAQTEQLTSSYEKCKTAAEELKKTISNWSEGVEALEALDKSTEEYKNKLEEVNDQARELIETYKLYDDYKIENGVIKFNDGVLENLQSEKDQRANSVENQLYASKIITNQATIKSQGTDLGREQGYLVDTTMIDPNGNYVSRNATSSEMQQFAEAINNYRQQDGRVELDAAEIQKALEEGIDGLPQIIKDNISSITTEDIQAVIDFHDSMVEATEANRYYAEQIAQNSVESLYRSEYEQAAKDEKGNVDNQLVEGMINAGARFGFDNTKVDGQTLEDKIKEVDVSDVTSNADLSDYTDKNGNAYNIEDDKDLGLTYAKDILGWEASDISYKAGTGEGTLTNATTGEEMTLDDEFMRQALAQQSEIDQITSNFNTALESNMESFNSAMTSMVQNASPETANVLLNALGTDSKDIDYDQLVQQFSPEELMALNEGGITSEELMDTLGLSQGDLEALSLQSGKEFLDGFAQAMSNYDASEFYANVATKAREAASKAAEEEGFNAEDSEAIGEYATHLMQISKESDELADSLMGDSEAAADLAVQVSKMNRGVDTLANNFEDWGDVLKNSSKESMEYSEAMQGTQKALGDLLDVEEQYISDDFVTEHLDEIKKAATGDAEAIDALSKALSEQIVLDIAGVDDVESLPDKMREALTAMQTAVDNASFDVGEKVELDIDETGFIDACQGIVNAAGMSVEEAQAYFDSLGYTPEFEMTNVTETAPMYGKKVFTDDPVIAYAPDGNGGEYPYIAEMTTREEQVYMGEHEQNFVVPKLGDDGAPIIKSVTKKATGSFNNYSSSNKGGKSSGKGGGGSKPKAAKKIDKTKKEDIVERYKEITDALDDVSDAMKKADTLSDRLYGSAKVKAMQTQLKLLEKEGKLLKEKEKQAKANLKIDQKALQQKAKAAGVSLEFDNKGNITNYTQQMEKLYAELAAAENKANSFKNQEEQDKYTESTLEPIQEKIEELKSYMEMYEETRELLEDLEIEIQENAYAQIDKELEIFNYKFEVKLEINETDKKFLDTLMNFLENKPFTQAEKIGHLIQQGDLALNDLDTYEDQFYGVLKNILTPEDFTKLMEKGINAVDFSKYGDKFTQETIDTLNEALDGSLESAQELYEIQEQIMNMGIEAWEEWDEVLSEGVSKLEHASSLIDHIKNITSLTKAFTGFSAEVIKTLSAASSAAAQEQVRSAKAILDAKKQAYDNAVASGLLTEEQKRQMEADIREAEENLAGATESAIQAFMDEMTAIVEATMREFEQRLAGSFKSFEAMTEGLSRFQEVSQRYVSDYEKFYKLSKLNRDLQKDIDKSNSTKARQQMLELQEEINKYTQEGVEMSAYDVEFLEKKIELRKAEIALQDVQNAKSAVIRQRTNEGGWGYVYTADENKTMEAMQQYEDKLYEITKFNEDTMNQISSDILNIYTEFQDAIMNIHTRWQEGYYATEAEYRAALAETESYYNSLMAYRLSELDKTVVNSNELYYQDWTNYSSYIDDKRGALGNMKLSEEDFFLTFEATTFGQITGYVSANEAFMGYAESIALVLPKLAEAFVTTKDNINTTLGMVGDGLNLDNINTKIQDFIGDEKTEGTLMYQMKTIGDEIDTKCGDMVDDLDSVFDAMSKWTTIDFSDLLKDLGASKSIIQDIKKELNKDTPPKKEEEKCPKCKKPKSKCTCTKNTGGGTSGTKTQGNGQVDVGDIVTYTGKYYYDSYGTSPAGSIGSTVKNAVMVDDVVKNPATGNGQLYYVHLKGNPNSQYKDSKNLGWVSKDQISGYDTGGYTGEWGPEGRLAMLHQKEIVLNARDTENMLAMTQMVRDIARQIDLTAVPMSQSLTPAAVTDAYRDIQQNVTIHAEFPDATSAKEIEEAFNTLTLQAAQYINRK